MAAVLAAGPGAALSHASAAALWEIRPTEATLIDVSMPTSAGRTKRPGLRIHRATSLQSDETTRHQAIPVTTPARTLLDLASRGERGARRLAATLAEHVAGTTLTPSALEEAFLALCAAHGLERPQTNVRVCDLEVDFLFAAQRLVVEADSWRFHRTRQAFERDRQRDAILACAGYRTLRVTDRQLTRRPSEVLAAIAAARTALRSSA
jgi:very-short-patch-repair endonuclease